VAAPEYATTSLLKKTWQRVFQHVPLAQGMRHVVVNAAICRRLTGHGFLALR
jgi:hypothetical protein